MAKAKKYVYVLSQEHYHFEPNEHDMVAATPRLVSKDAAKLVTEAKKLMRYHWEKFGSVGEIKDYTDNSFGTLHEYRVWVDGRHKHMDKFVYVVRRTELVA